MLERLQKILSARGIASRRKAEEYIDQGLVKVNGIVAKVGDKADPERDNIEVDGKVLEARQQMLYYLLNKPVGVVTTNANRVEDKTVKDLLPPRLKNKIVPVGRLDKDSSGLLLLTNDGVLAFRLTHPKFHHEKEYQVTVEPAITPGALSKLKTGMTILGEKTKPTRIKRLNSHVFLIALTEGKNRQIRRMCQKVGCTVTDLRRTRIMNVEDRELRTGELRRLDPDELKTLLDSIGIGKSEE